MTSVKQAIGLAVLLALAAVLVGCSTPAAEETKPLQAGDGSKSTGAVPNASGGPTSGNAIKTTPK